MKYHNVKYYGFDSKREAQRYSQLKMLEDAGEIENLQTQVKFELIPSQRIGRKVVERACHYIADFAYYEDGKMVVEDTKGFRTKDYVIKRKLMLYRYGIQIREI